MSGQFFHCRQCREGYRGYHECDEGPDRVEFTCGDCGEHFARERNSIDLKGVTPERCATCTPEAMKHA